MYNNFEQLFDDLKSFNLQSVQDVFTQYANDPGFEIALMDYIDNHHKEFKMAIASINKSSDPVLERQCLFLKNISLDNQIKVLDFYVPTNVESIEIMASSPGCNLDKLLQNNLCQQFVSTNFAKENFTTLDKLNEIFQTNVLAVVHNSGYFHGIYNFFGNPTILPRYVQFEDNIFAPSYNIIFEYSNAKEAYLLSQNIALPSIEQAEKITTNIIASLKEYESHDEKDSDYLHKGLANYIKVKMYYDLQQDLPASHHHHSQRKI